MKAIIRHADIVCVNTAMDIIHDGDIVVEDEKIAFVGKLGDVDPETSSYQTIDASGLTAMPGLINAHTHLPMTMLRGYADDMPLDKWLNSYIFPAEAKLCTPENIKKYSELSIKEMIKSGTTCFADMYYLEKEIAEVVKKTGIRAILGEAVIDFPCPGFKTPEEGFIKAEQLIKSLDTESHIHKCVCVHSPYTCSENTLKQSRVLANKYNIPLHIHLSETSNEVKEMNDRNGMTPTEYLQSIGFFDGITVAAHSVWLTDNDIKIYSTHNVSAAHCPKSNLKLASGIMNTPKMLDSGINIAIGTDGAASNNTLDMIEEMRFAALLPKGRYGNATTPDASTALRMATINGAKAFGLDNIIGSIEKGKRADIIFIDTAKANIQPMHNIISNIVYAMNSSNITKVMVNGSWLLNGSE